MSHLRRGEYHAFEGGGAQYLYLVPSAAVVRLDDTSLAVLDAVGDRDVPVTEVTDALSARWDAIDVRATITELLTVRAIKPWPSRWHHRRRDPFR